MPESSRRKKTVYKPIAEVQREAQREVSREPVRFESPRWLAPTMSGLFIVGLLYVVVFYIQASASDFSIAFMEQMPGGNLTNVGIGFGLMGAGFVLATRWR